MCGIFGIMQHENESVPNQQNLEITASLLRHRGPDNYGIFADKGIGLVHTRLSLLDLNPRSNQPFWDQHGRYCLIYNGEIYNYKELRTELEKQDVRFMTTSDTEVLLKCLIHLGVETTLPMLEGMFAFALYDKHEHSLVLARDRFGIKPLFIYDQEDAFIFASEIRAMQPWISFKPDILMISSYLQGFGVPTKGYSFFLHVKIVSPGEVINIRLGERARYSRFFVMSNFWDDEEIRYLKQIKSQQVVDKVDELLLNSVKMQLAADAPVGALCSGGVDSSIIMAMASKFHNNLAIFHANVVGRHSEYEAAAILAKHLRLDLKTVDVVDQDFIDLLPEVAVHYGHPFSYHPNSIPFIAVSKLVRRNGVKAVLSGEGSDECYLGYPLLAPNMALLMRKLPRQAYPILKQLIKRLLGRRLDSAPIGDKHRLVMGLHNRFEREVENENIRLQIQRISGKTLQNRDLNSLYLLGYHLRTLLHRNDCLGMAASIEARFPFLDSRLVKLSVNMPYKYKIRFSPIVLEKSHYFFRDKWIIRKVADRYLPPELSHRPKYGFPTSAQHRMLIPAAFFQRSFIADLFGLSNQEIQYLVDHANQELKLKLLHLEVWAHVCLHHASRDLIIRKLKDHITVRQDQLRSS